MTQNCGEEHGRVCAKVEELEELKPCLKSKLSKHVFTLAVTACLMGFSALSGWVGYVQGVSAEERKAIVTKYDAKFEKLTDAISELRMEVMKLNVTLKQIGIK